MPGPSNIDQKKACQNNTFLMNIKSNPPRSLQPSLKPINLSSTTTCSNNNTLSTFPPRTFSNKLNSAKTMMINFFLILISVFLMLSLNTLTLDFSMMRKQIKPLIFPKSPQPKKSSPQFWTSVRVTQINSSKRISLIRKTMKRHRLQALRNQANFRKEVAKKFFLSFKIVKRDKKRMKMPI